MKVVFSVLFVGCLALMSGCASQLDQQQHQTLETLPSGLQQVVQAEPPDQQQKFLSMPAEKREAIVRQWEQREQIMQGFTPSERMMISTLPATDQDKFFALSREQREPFLADKAKLQHQALINCLTLTHRRFGQYITGVADHEHSTQRFTPTEQAIISGLSADESQKLFSLPADQQEGFLTDTVRGDTDQLISCMTKSHRHLGDAP